MSLTSYLSLAVVDSNVLSGMGKVAILKKGRNIKTQKTQHISFSIQGN